ncbi:N-6 DNA methylase [Agromyces sp. Root1464]|uniref:N-6 DNA methylase n=1 Tax=Agromyces sp. Root1464 TaxID=1736467 RepID=UPI00138EF869|nr:N-6 DNA methylase [Agromyces sp. Root1464]
MQRDRVRVDDYYTPVWAAEALANVLPASLAGAVLDPAVGGGALLEAVEMRFGGEVSLLGIDVSEDAVRQLRNAHSEWSVSTADLLRASSRAASRVWRAARRDDLAAVVMNPPFSYRGNGGAIIEYLGFRGRVAPSMHFLTEVVRSLNPSEGFFAIMPDGALDAERHQDLWQQLMLDYDVERLLRLSNSSFRGARVSTSIVRLQPRRNPPTVATAPIAAFANVSPPPKPQPMSYCRCIEVVRGRVPLHSLPSLAGTGTTVPFIHTTELESTTLVRSAPERLADIAPLLLISRVGKWRTPRLIEVGHIVLSDCLFGIRPRDNATLGDLITTLPTLASDLERRMRGTGAPYLTLADVTSVLRDAGWHVHIIKASGTPGDCCCDSSILDCGASPQPQMLEAGPSGL